MIRIAWSALSVFLSFGCSGVETGNPPLDLPVQVKQEIHPDEGAVIKLQGTLV